MTYRELLAQKLMDNGATKQQTESKIVDIMITTLALEADPDLKQFVYIIEGDKEYWERKRMDVINKSAELSREINECRVKEGKAQEKYDQLQEKEKSLQALRDQIDECETKEAKDRIRLADRFTGMIERKGGITNGYERTAYIKSLGMILGTKCQNEEGES